MCLWQNLSGSHLAKGWIAIWLWRAGTAIMLFFIFFCFCFLSSLSTVLLLHVNGFVSTTNLDIILFTRLIKKYKLYYSCCLFHSWIEATKKNNSIHQALKFPSVIMQQYPSWGIFCVTRTDCFHYDALIQKIYLLHK